MNHAIKILGISIAIGISIILGIIIYGEITRPAGFTANEGEWIVGNGLNDGSNLTYKINIQNKIMLINLQFNEVDNGWLTIVTIDNKTYNLTFTRNLIASNVPEEFKEWDDIKNSLFWIVEYVFEPKPLMGNAVWSTVEYNFGSAELKVISKENIITSAGEFEGYKIAYYVGYSGGGEFWIVKDLPLPVKAQVFDVDGILQFKYELISYTL